jgi:hypothetical protein
LPTDLNEDGRVDPADIDTLCASIRTGDQFDLNGDDEVNYEDVVFFVRTMLNSEIGDSNLDGKFGLDDLQTDEYDDGIAGNSTWSEGDWNCDGDFDSRDIVLAFSEGSPLVNALDREAIRSTRIAASIDIRSSATPFALHHLPAKESRDHYAGRFAWIPKC